MLAVGRLIFIYVQLTKISVTQMFQQKSRKNLSELSNVPFHNLQHLVLEKFIPVRGYNEH